jgi:UDP-N-acetyl-2-amino-2-deoxyglucuronate dehydrogenase
MNIALVGCGRISKRHIEAIDATDGAHLTAVCDIEPERMSTGLLEGRDLLRVTDYAELSGKGIDAVVVCTPSGLHPVHAAEIAEQTDIPNVVVEKPISLTVREAVAMFKRVDAAGKHLVPIYQNRYNPLVQFVRDLIREGKLGTIHQFNVNIFWNRNDDYFKIGWHGTQDLDGGVLYTQASHYVDMLLYLFGPVDEAKGLGGRLRGLEVQDSISAAVRHENGAVGSLNCTVSTFRRNYQT